MNRSNYFNFINEKLSSLATCIDLGGSLNLLDVHIHSEIFFRDLFNLIFGWNLKKTEHHNEPGIDLVDITNNIVVSISGTATKPKIEFSLNKINSNYSSYAFKFISISKDASKLRTHAYLNPHKLIFFPEEDIYDVSTLLKLIFEMKIDQLREVYEFLKKELDNEFNPERLKPIDHLKNYLHDCDNWKMFEHELSSTLHYEQFPEFTIVQNDDFDEEYKEPWVLRFPDKLHSGQLEYFAKYRDTTLAEIYLVYCDAGRFLTAKPREWLKDSPLTYYYTYYFIKDSIEYLAGKMINEKKGSVNCRCPSIHNEFQLFGSEEEASQLIEADFAGGMHQYIYYSFDKKTQKYSRIGRGVSSPINQ